MKKIVLFVTAAFLFTGIAFAQNGKTTEKKAKCTKECCKKGDAKCSKDCKGKDAKCAKATEQKKA